MRTRISLFFLPILFLVASAAPARCADTDKTQPPTLVVQAKSLDTLLSDAKYLAAFTGQEGKGMEIDSYINSVLGDKWTQAIDTTKTAGLYAQNGLDVVAVIPILNDKAFLDLLNRFNQKTEKDDDDLYTVTPDDLPIPIYFRIVNKYVYATAMNRSALDKDRLIEPAKLFSPARTGTISALLHGDQVPDLFKEIALQTIDQEAAKLQDKQVSGETALEQQLWTQTLEDVARQLAAVVRDGGDLEAQADVDHQSQEIAGEIRLTAKPGSALSKVITKLSPADSPFTGIPGADSALSILGHGYVPADVRTTLHDFIGKEFQKALDKEKDPAKREPAEKFLKALEPSLQAGELEGALSLRGPDADQHYTLVAGIKVKNGAGVEQAARDLVKTLNPRDRKKVQLDGESAGDVKIQRVDLQKDLDDLGRQTLGENPLYLAIRGDDLFVSAGPDGLKAIKEALAAQPKPAPECQVELSMSRLIPLMLQEKGAAKAGQEAFAGADKNSDKLRFVMEGGQSMKVRFSVKTPVLKFFSSLVNKDGAEEDK